MISLSDKKKALEHIYYEFSTLCECVNRLAEDVEQSEKNILLDSFAIHARNLYYFFYSTPKQDDISIEHYLQGITEHLIPKGDLEKIVSKGNKQVAHLTYSRNNYGFDEKKWIIGDIFPKLVENMQIFTINLPNEYKDSEYVEYLNKMLHLS